MYYFFWIFKNLYVAETEKMEDLCHLHHYSEKYGYRFPVFQNFGNQYPAYQHINPEDLSPQRQHYRNLKAHICKICVSVEKI